ncbi:putative ubiquitin-conjugating enzyme E2 23 [Orobanche minor]
MGPISCIPDVSAQTDDHHFILINNLEKDLTPSEIKKFIHEKTTILPEACVFPSLSTDPFARGAIMVDSKKKAQTIQEYLENKDHFVVSSRGRPWVITMKASAKLFAASIGNFMSASRMESAGQQSDVLDADGQKDAYHKETCGPTGDSNIGCHSSITDDEDEDEVDNRKDDENAVDGNESNDSKNEALNAGEVRVLWLDGSETTECIKDVELIDRGFLHGDHVAVATDRTGQIGIVVDVSINVDLLTHDGSLVRIKPSRELKRIRDFTVGDHVVLGSWLGRIEDVFDNVTVQLDYGSVCRVMKGEPQHLKPVGMIILLDGDCPYYPGQRVQARSSSIFKNSQWLSELWKANGLEGTVTKVTVVPVFIYWIASAGCGPDSATTPAKEQSPKNLKLLSCFDWCLLPPSKESLVATLNRGSMKADSHDSAKDEPESTAETGDDTDAEVAKMEHSYENNKSKENDIDGSLDQTCETSENKAFTEDLCNSLVPASKDIPHETWPLHRKNLRKVVVRKDKKARKKVENFERALLIINTSTEVDVVWQDGKINRDLDPRALIPIDSPGDHEFFAEQYVVEKATDIDDTVEPKRVGVIKSFDAKDRTACVSWLSPITLPDKKDSFVHSVDNMPLSDPNELKLENGWENTENTTDHEKSTEFYDLSWVGNITGFSDGDIEVTWADGIISTVGPQAIYVVGLDDDESMAVGSDGDDDAASWETADDDADSVNPEEHGMENAVASGLEIEDDPNGSEYSGKSGALSLPVAAIGFMPRLASGIFSRGQRNSDPLDIDIRNEDDLQLEGLTLTRDRDNGSSSQKAYDMEEHLAKPTTKCKEEEHDAAEARLLEIAETLCNIKAQESNDLAVKSSSRHLEVLILLEIL